MLLLLLIVFGYKELLEPLSLVLIGVTSGETAHINTHKFILHAGDTMARFFGTNGIRGVVGKELTLAFLHDMTLAIGTFLGGPILVGYDGRKSGPMLCNMVCAALHYGGINCNVAGMVPTPCLEYAVKSLGYSGGIMITASHNPPEYNGIKPVASDGVEISRSDELAVEEIYRTEKWTRPVEWGRTGTEVRAVTAYLDGIVSQIDSDRIRSKGFGVVLDLGNGAQVASAPELCNILGCKTHLVNEKLDGDFPGRGSEPTPQNLSALSEAVVKNHADLGIAFDGDGDRSIFCDERGNVLTGDSSALVLARHILGNRPKSIAVTCLNSGSGVESLAAQSGSRVIRTKVGSVEVSRMMVQTGALIGFEENGGFMYGPHNQVRDGCMALALMLDALAAASDMSLSGKVSELPPSFTTKDKIPCPAQSVPGLVSALKDEFPDSDTTDGIRISLDSKEWVMIRPSGTEPIVRIYAEAKSKDRLDGIISEYSKKIRSILDSHTG